MADARTAYTPAAGGVGVAGKLLYRAGRSVVALLLSLLARPRVYGAAAVPRRGPLLVVANHASNIDPMLLALAILTRNAGDTTAALRYARMLVESHPDDPRVPNLLRSLGRTR